MPIRYRTRDVRDIQDYIRSIVFFFFFLHASVIATRAIIQFYSIFFFFLTEARNGTRNKLVLIFNSGGEIRDVVERTLLILDYVFIERANRPLSRGNNISIVIRYAQYTSRFRMIQSVFVTEI